MDPLLPLLALAAFATAALSATFGMLGGLVLMGVYTALLPVPEAMVLHGVTQLVANGGRAVLLRRHLATGGLLAFAAGAGAAWLLFRQLAWTPSAAVVHLGLGAVPFLALALPATPALEFGHRRGAALAGLLVGGTQLAFGVAGPLLDVFFARGELDRHAVVATKGATQVLTHGLKVAAFLPLVAAAPGLLAPAVVTVGAATLGTRAGARLLDRLPEATFRRWTRRLVLAAGAMYLARGAWAL